MGRRNQDQGHLFYSFDLDAVVPNDHLVREIAAVLDLNWVHGELAPHYPRIGRPSIDPVLMIRMLIVGYVFAKDYVRCVKNPISCELCIAFRQGRRCYRPQPGWQQSSSLPELQRITDVARDRGIGGSRGAGDVHAGVLPLVGEDGLQFRRAA